MSSSSGRGGGAGLLLFLGALLTLFCHVSASSRLAPAVGHRVLGNVLERALAPATVSLASVSVALVGALAKLAAMILVGGGAALETLERHLPEILRILFLRFHG